MFLSVCRSLVSQSALKSEERTVAKIENDKRTKGKTKKRNEKRRSIRPTPPLFLLLSLSSSRLRCSVGCGLAAMRPLALPLYLAKRFSFRFKGGKYRQKKERKSVGQSNNRFVFVDCLSGLGLGKAKKQPRRCLV